MTCKIKKQFNVFVLVSLIALTSCSTKQSTTDIDGRPLITKLGTIDVDIVETTPVVFNGKVYRFEYIRDIYWNNKTDDSYFRFIDHETGQATKSFAKGFHLGSAYVDEGTIYVTAVDNWDGEKVFIFASKDMEHWESWLAFELPGFGIFNTTMIKDDNKYVLMYEIGKPEEEAGERFTAHFATSTDLKEWNILPSKYNYAKDRYTAPHCLRYLDGYYYNFYLEYSKGFEMRVVRSKDLLNWEASPMNPVLRFSDADRKIANKNIPEKFLNKIAIAENRNNSDIDFCEFNGKLIINYSWGDQRGEEFLAEAVYQGTLEQFLKGWFKE